MPDLVVRRGRFKGNPTRYLPSEATEHSIRKKQGGGIWACTRPPYKKEINVRDKRIILAENYLQKAAALHSKSIETAIKYLNAGNNTDLDWLLKSAREHYDNVRNQVYDLEFIFGCDESLFSDNLKAILRASGVIK